MINHIRTLLLNPTAGADTAEYSDPGFNTLEVPQWLANVGRGVMGSGSSLYQRRLRVESLLSILHHCDLLPYTLYIDSRTTYTIGNGSFENLRTGGLTVSRSSRDSGTDMHVELSAHPVGGQGLYDWDIAYQGAGSDIVVSRDGSEGESIHMDFSGISSRPLVLIPESCYIWFEDPTGALTGTFRNSIRLESPLVMNPAALLDDFEKMERRAAISHRLFEGDGDLKNTLNKLYEIWNSSSEPALRIGAFVLGYAFQLERVRRGEL